MEEKVNEEEEVVKEAENEEEEDEEIEEEEEISVKVCELIRMLIHDRIYSIGHSSKHIDYSWISQ